MEFSGAFHTVFAKRGNLSFSNFPLEKSVVDFVIAITFVLKNVFIEFFPVLC